ncbi:MAG: hypothetical protein KIS77_06270 [Saprospiraceae bacterium]|nr:hypothetical protein [Saprospiraceae bacterium]
MRFQKYCMALVAVGLLFFAQDGLAQSKSKKKSDSSSEFKSRLWYGGGLLLGFSGSSFGNLFQFGLAPQVGYKIVEPLSIGPRASFVFGSYKQPGFKATNLFNTDIGGFVRFRVYQGFFLQGELTNEWYQGVDRNTTSKFKRTRFNQRIGAGYNFAGGRGGAGSEIAIMYNFAIANDLDTYENPLEYRLGFTWNF